MRPPWRPAGSKREHRQRFWAAIRRGLPSEHAAVKAGVLPVVGDPVVPRGWRDASDPQAPLSVCFLSFAEREEIAILHARGCGVREIARRIARSPSTISRELRRERGDPGRVAGVPDHHGAVARPTGAPGGRTSPSCAAAGWSARSAARW